ncbi:uncharacterized protein CELE_F36F12.7 [Caenorhabditis elegans]|uniref:Uncharacterized protein n=1 Tax=Caenorhabditis elegans TaxID=6239 RepID=O76402_CAEEL|nr:Uncharacterized protein CELE_F36F12.7 [Caenorhabditis elegans]CCD69874.1 Uncharacterized protein CELE_F36F12.7 [Caenorhabditis elegans]|eukprot:NP_503570.1 Uncharacterized protein CELE_F36F12.7 [Caenorhabditis elegans]
MYEIVLLFKIILQILPLVPVLFMCKKSKPSGAKPVADTPPAAMIAPRSRTPSPGAGKRSVPRDGVSSSVSSSTVSKNEPAKKSPNNRGMSQTQEVTINNGFEMGKGRQSPVFSVIV